jgi:hypothetical protein
MHVSHVLSSIYVVTFFIHPVSGILSGRLKGTCVFFLGLEFWAQLDANLSRTSNSDTMETISIPLFY